MTIETDGETIIRQRREIDRLKAELLKTQLALSEQLTANRWIPVGERLPEKETTDLGEEYLCMIGGSYNIVTALNYDSERGFYSGWISRTYWTSRVTHWKPLPPPEPEAHDGA